MLEETYLQSYLKTEKLNYVQVYLNKRYFKCKWWSHQIYFWFS